MKDKYIMTREENLSYAKRNIVDLIYCSAKIEGIAVTFPQTYELYEGRSVAGLSVDDIVKINNLKKSWQFIFDTIDYPVDLRYIKQINQLVQNGLHPLSGQIRTDHVTIGGTKWKPDLPNETEYISKIEKILNMECATERAITIMEYLMRAQLFWDGNKRTAQLIANQILIQNCCGILAIPVEKNLEFTEKLIDFYETGNDGKMKQFIYENAIDGYNKEQKKSVSKKMNKELDLDFEIGK